MIKNIILIGKTGSGKSTIANVISSTSKFEEGFGTTSKTKEIKSESFINSDVNYQVIDTVGLEDTSLPPDEVLDKIADAVYLVRAGIHQIFFVVRNRMDSHQIEIYNILKTVIFDEQSVKFTTIIRTEFNDFNKEESVRNDIDLITDSENGLSTIAREVNNRFVHIDNPTLAISCDNCEEFSCKRCSLKISINKRYREDSKIKLLSYLNNNINSENYVSEKLKSLSEEISTYMENKILKKEEFLANEKVKEFERKQDEEKLKVFSNSFRSSLNDFENLSINFIDNDQKIKEKKISNVIKGLFKRSKKLKLIQENKRMIEISIKELKDWREVKRLKEEIINLDKQIRDKIRVHILHNKDEINQVSGGNELIKIIENGNNNLGKGFLTELTEQQNNCQDKLDFSGKSTLSLLEINQKVKENEYYLLSLRKYQFELDQDLLKKWVNSGFIQAEIFIWSSSLREHFNPEQDINFCVWLRNNKHYTADTIQKLQYIHEITELRAEYDKSLDSEINIYKQHKQLLESEHSDNHTHDPSQAQTWLNKNYPSDKRAVIKKLDIRKQNLTGTLDLTDFIKLEKLNCAGNQLTSCQLTNCSKLKHLYCYDNQLQELELTHCPHLQYLICANNQLTKLDIASWTSSLNYLGLSNNEQLTNQLSDFSHLINLTRLDCAKTAIAGSCSSLQNCSRLKTLAISQTKINTGLEYLPAYLEQLHCHSNQFPELEPYHKGNYYDYQAWRKDHQALLQESTTTRSTSFDHYS